MQRCTCLLIGQCCILLAPCRLAKRGLMKAPLSAIQSLSQNYFLSKTTDRISMKPDPNIWFVKARKVMQSRKNVILVKKPKITLKVRLYWFGKKTVLLMCYFWVYMMHCSCLYDSAKTHVSEKSISQVINENALGQSDCEIF